MKICEVIFWNNEPEEENIFDPQRSDDLTNLAKTAFTRSGLVKHFWHLDGSGSQPSGPAPPNHEPELIPDGMLQPSAASWAAGPIETEPEAGQYRRVPLLQYRDRSAY